MRLNDFGKKARLLRMDYDLALKEQADSMSISSSHLSGLEYGDKTLNEAHIESAIQFFKTHNVPAAELEDLRAAGGRSLHSVNTKEMDADARELVFAFARKLQQGDTPQVSWTKKKTK